uniref:Putative secreted protein n=1 Tax=Anopheles darlingi TaxID=43151 RepID=A0A2M4D7G9_ANODA
MRFFVSCMTWSTLTKVAALPTVGSLTVNCSVCTYVGTLSRCSSSSFFGGPAGTWYENWRTTLYSRFASSAKYSACVKRSCVVRSVPSPLVNWYIEKAIADMFLARFTMSLFSSDAPFHLSVSASISLVTIFISSPVLAIFSCSSESSRVGLSGLEVVPCLPGRGRLRYSVVLSPLVAVWARSITSLVMVVTSVDSHCHMSTNTSRFSLAILLCGCDVSARAAVITCGP